MKTRTAPGTTDHRSALAKARDEWLESDEGKRCLNGSAQGVYLKNRLVEAFCAGADFGETFGRELAGMIARTKSKERNP